MQRARYGIDCAHVYHVISQFQCYKEPSHHECSVRWWSSFSQYGHYGNTSETTNETRLMAAFGRLSVTDLSGLPTNGYLAEKIGIVSDLNCIPSKFKASEFPKCINFPNLKVTQDQLRSNMFNVTGLTQYATSFGTDETFFDDFMKNPDFYNEAISTSKPNGRPANSDAYQELLPYYKDLVNQMENYTDEEMCQVKQMFTEKTGHFKRKAYKELLKSTEKNKPLAMKVCKKRKYVSSSIPSSKKKKPHGTNY